MALDRERALNIARRYRKAVESEFEIVSLWLYGSCARDMSDEMSDIDIAVILKEITSPMEISLRLMQIRREIDNRIEPFPIRMSDWNRENPLAFNIMHEGIEIQA